MRKPSSVALQVLADFRASHSLEGFETPHFHQWKLTLEFRSAWPATGDRVIDLVFVQDEVSKIVAPLDGAYLNTALPFSPTSENLAAWLWEQFLKRQPQAPLTAVAVTLCDLAGNPSGTARVEG